MCFNRVFAVYESSRESDPREGERERVQENLGLWRGSGPNGKIVNMRPGLLETWASGEDMGLGPGSLETGRATGGREREGESV